MDICEKIAYIDGLAEGLNLDETTKEGKILAAVIDLLKDITEEICDVEDALDDMGEQIDAVDEDLANLEDFVFEDECGCGCDCDCDDDCDCGCGCCDDEDLYEVECPNCHDTIYLDEDMLEDEGIDCPNCGTALEFDFNCDCDCDCCDCEDDK
ncbi:MAG: zinc-ribbon domain-containing protein [Clostridia bacterium]|nr:zinc-ribbon domain-containing protein [Clostridia bacterium]